ncbi:hypothetical protein [Flavobacterium xanthum]|uniref:Fibronectin type-III domain-containing protein n=1 Tax=Flavobacterium xanthum TaxID=69322 RepID=A0A1M7L8J7_9FLAO|nr:hypothetical protein [Flavobacterium xanthum]SHM74379.1 hypothetical protein SAMN05443669_10651 [Flavobacterium xanthum]
MIKLRSIYKYFVLICLATLSSCEEILLEDNISTSEVNLTAPRNNAQLSSTSVNLSWEEVQYATSYHLQIAKPNFENPSQIILDTIISKNNFIIQLNIGQYEWRVKAINSAYETHYKSRFFFIESNADFKNNTVVLLNPSSNLNTKSTNQNFSWQEIIGASNYQFQLYDQNNTIIENRIMTNTSLNYTLSEGDFSWRVRASNDTEQTLYSSRSLLVDTTAPITPILTNPTNNSTTINLDINFQWNRAPMSGSIEKDSLYIYKDSALTVLESKNQATNPYSKTLTVGKYYWIVRSFDAAGNVSAKSTIFNFTIN